MTNFFENWSQKQVEKFYAQNWVVSCPYGDDEDWIDDLIHSNLKQEWECDAFITAVQDDMSKMTLNQIFAKYTNNNYPYLIDAE